LVDRQRRRRARGVRRCRGRRRDRARPDLRAAAQEAGVTALAFPDLAQASPTYADYTAAVAATPTVDIGVHAIALLGSGNAVRRLTRHLPALTDPVPEPVS
jgi:hypothetical protein